MPEADYWSQVEELVHEALRRNPGEQAGFVAAIEDPAVRAEVESLLEAGKNRPELNLAGRIGEAASHLLAEGVDLSGRTLGHFELLRRIGVGGMSEVYLARDLYLGRHVAVKLPPAAFGRETQRGRRFMQEARAASALNHPNILTIFEIGEAGAQLYIAMEYVEGESLRQRLGRGAMTIAESLAAGEQIACGLAAAHAAGIIHRDIKPDNIMLRPDGVVKILDFGLARLSVDRETDPIRTLAGSLVGTPLYMSPEQARGLPLDARTDLWSLGAMLYEMMTGAAAFRGDNTADILVSILEQQPRRLSVGNPQCPAGLDELVHALLSKDIERRPASAAQVAEGLRALRERYASDVRRPLAPPKPRARRRAGRYVALAAALLLAAVGGWLLIPRPSREKGPALRQFTTNLEENRVTAAAVSPDGRQVAYAERNGPLVLRAVAGPEIRAIPLPDALVVEQIAWYRDGTQLLLSVEATATRLPGLWRIPLSRDASRLLHEDARLGAPSPDGHAIAFTNSDQTQVLVMDAEGRHVRKLVAGDRSETFPVLLWSADSRRLSYQRRRYRPRAEGRAQIAESELDYRRSFETIRVESGERTAAQSDVRMETACTTNSGRILFLRPDAAEYPFLLNLWEVQADSKTGALAGAPRRLTNQKDGYMTGLSCSADGKVAGVLAQAGVSSIFIAGIERPGAQLAGIRRLTFNGIPAYPHAWTADSQAVIFEMGNNQGRWNLYFQRLDERVAFPLTAGPGSEITPQLSPDGNWVLYCDYDTKAPKTRSLQRLMRVPVGGGTPVEVPVAPGFDEFRCALSGGKRCVLRTIENGQYLYSELDALRGRGRELARTPWFPAVMGDWGLSSDGTRVAVPSHDAREARIHVLPLDAPPGTPEGRDIEAKGLSRLRGVYWAADDRGWYVSLNSSTGVKLAYVDGNGAATVLRESPIVTWGVPSPDGRSLAFVDQALFSNVWLLDRR